MNKKLKKRFLEKRKYFKMKGYKILISPPRGVFDELIIPEKEMHAALEKGVQTFFYRYDDDGDEAYDLEQAFEAEIEKFIDEEEFEEDEYEDDNFLTKTIERYINDIPIKEDINKK